MSTVLDLEQKALAAMRSGNLEEAERLADAADNLDRQRRKATLAEAAHWYASMNLKVFPLRPGTKLPYTGSHGCKDATTNPDQITAWWGVAPTSNIGIATGHQVDVIDIDGPQGVQAWLGDLWGQLPPILAHARTIRRGGHHLYVEAIPGARNRAGMLPGVDYRAEGGYVVAPPSIVDGRAYRWIQLPSLNIRRRHERAAA